MIGGGGGGGEKTKKKSCKGKCPKKKSCKEKTGRTKFMHKLDHIFLLNKNSISSQKVFQNAPNDIGACLDFQNFPSQAKNV